jgi:hypothetical protein
MTRPDLTRQDVRFWLIENYWLILQPRTDSLLIIAVAHTSRDIRTLLKDVSF